MIKRKTWREFQKSGLLWWINTQLHLFGWAIVLSSENGQALEAFPARTDFRGFSEKCNNKGYKSVTKYLKKNICEIEKALEEDK